MVESVCRRYHITPPDAVALPVWVFRHMAILAEAQPREQVEG